MVSTGLRLPMGSRLATYLCRDERPNGRSLQRRRHVGRASECRPNRMLQPVRLRIAGFVQRVVWQ